MTVGLTPTGTAPPQPPDLVYLVRPGDNNEELRWSLRTTKNLPHSRVWLIGHKPVWAQNVEHVPGNRHTVGHLNVLDNLRIAAATESISEEFVVMNDDFFVMRPVSEYRYWHRGRLDDHINGIRRWSAWKQSLIATQAWLEDRGIENPLSYELHVPVLMTKTRLTKTIEEIGEFSPLYPPQWRTVYFHMWPTPTAQRRDVKVWTAGQWDPESEFISTHDDSFRRGRVGAHVREMFPEPSQYERKAAPNENDGD